VMTSLKGTIFPWRRISTNDDVRSARATRNSSFNTY